MAPRQLPGQVITFYSYKGGTGRSMALANVACLLAQGAPSGKGVLMVDWDLEAPGLHRYFHGNLRPQAEQTEEEVLEKSPGLLDLFAELDSATQHDVGQTEEAASALLASITLKDFVLPTQISALHLLKAGRFDATYPTRVNTFQWAALYTRAPFLLRAFAEWLTAQYQYVLIDSRTGLTDVSGICTMLLPEKLVVVFTPNRQSLTGLLDLVRRATDYRRQAEDLRPLLAFPLPSRIEAAEPQLREDWRLGNAERGIVGYQPQFEALLQEVYDLPECHLETYFDEVQIQHIPRYAYGEDIAVLVERRSDRLSLTRSYENFAEQLVGGSGPWDYGKIAASTPVTPPLFDAYVSSSSADRLPVQGIADALQAQGLRLWRFEEQVAPGEVIEQAIAQGIAQAKTLVFFLGSHGLGLWQEQELLRAQQANTQRIIPVLLPGVEPLSESLPPALRERFMLQLHGQPDDADVLDRLVWGITGERPSRTPVSPLQSVTNSIGMVFTLIPAGAFLMGWPDGGEDERPVHSVRISQAFYLGTYAVTQGQWEAVMGTNPSGFKGDGHLPVEEVSWEDVQAFIQQLNAREGGTRYRLPT